MSAKLFVERAVTNILTFNLIYDHLDEIAARNASRVSGRKRTILDSGDDADVREVLLEKVFHVDTERVRCGHGNEAFRCKRKRHLSVLVDLASILRNTGSLLNNLDPKGLNIGKDFVCGCNDLAVIGPLDAAVSLGGRGSARSGDIRIIKQAVVLQALLNAVEIRLVQIAGKGSGSRLVNLSNPIDLAKASAINFQFAVFGNGLEDDRTDAAAN